MRKVKLSEVCDISSGGTPSRANPEHFKGDIPWAKISDIENAVNGVVHETEEHISDEGLKNIRGKLFPKGTLLFAMYGSIGKVGICGRELSTNQAILGIRPKRQNEIDLGYLKIWFASNKQRLINQGRGAALKNLSATIIRELEVDLPSFDDQIRIAHLLGKVEALIIQRKQHLQQLDDLLKSVFLDMFGDPVRNEKRWSMVEVKDFSTSRLGKMRDKKFITGGNLRKYIGNSNVQWFRFVLDDLLEMDFDEREREIFTLQYGDLLVCEGGDIGRCAIWKNQQEDCYFQKALHRVRLNTDMAIAEYVQFVFLFYSKFNGFKITSKATIAHLTGEKLAVTKIPLPPVTLQKRFATIFEKVGGIKGVYSQSLNDLEALYGVLSQLAFKGDLRL